MDRNFPLPIAARAGLLFKTGRLHLRRIDAAGSSYDRGNAAGFYTWK